MGQYMRLVLIAYSQKPPLKASADIFSRARGLNFGPSLNLHPNFVYAISKVSLCLCICTDSPKYQNLVCWFKWASSCNFGTHHMSKNHMPRLARAFTASASIHQL